MGSFVVFGVDLVALSASINWYLIAYVILSVVSTIYGSFRLYEGGGGIRASVYGIGAGLIFIFFGYRWFSQPTQLSKKWPPVINMCPDYLTHVPIVQGKEKGACVDMIGVSSSSGGIQVSKRSDVANMGLTVNTNKIFSYTSADVAAAKSASELKPICDECKTKGVTWEGVYDGDVCTAIKTVDATNAALANCVASV
jgi:hypothetical protein